MFLARAASHLSARFFPAPGRARPPRQCRRELGTIGRPSGRRRANGAGTAMGAARAEDARQATAPVLGTVLGVNESVSLRVGARLEVGCVGSSFFLVRRILNRRDEVAEQHLGRRGLDAVRASVLSDRGLRPQAGAPKLRRRHNAEIQTTSLDKPSTVPNLAI